MFEYMNQTIFADRGEHSWHSTGSLEVCVMFVKYEPVVGYEGHATAGVEHGRAESGEMRVEHVCVNCRCRRTL